MREPVSTPSASTTTWAANHRLTFRANVSPSTVTGIEVSGQDQPFGQNAYSRTSQQTYRDVAGVFQDTWTIGNNKVNEFRFQYARRGLSYFYNTQIPGGSDPAVNIPGFAYFGREPYSYIQRTEQRYQFTDNFSWTIGRHNTKFGGDFNYLPLTATFTVNYGGVYDFGASVPLPGLYLSPIPGTATSPTSRRCRPTARACPEISSRASAVPATRSTTFPSAPSGRIRGASVQPSR